MDTTFHVAVVFFITIGDAPRMAEARYCPIEIDGDVKYYICPRHEICCTFGCCVSSNFHFSQLWYYWLMVILMFLLCSGGTWWYRYWLQGGTSARPPLPSHPHSHPRSQRPSIAHVTYHAGRNTVVLQQVWKPPRNGPAAYPTPPPSYSFVRNATEGGEDAASASASGAAAPPQASFYQLYGPPPSYDSVVTQSRPAAQAPPDRQQRTTPEDRQSNPPSRSHVCTSYRADT